MADKACHVVGSATHVGLTQALALMVIAIRVLIVLSMASFLVGAFLPFDHPFEVDLPLDRAPPAWFWATLAFVGVILAAAVASVGLLRLRRWGRSLGLVVAACGIAVVWLLAGSPLGGVVSGLAAPLMGLSALTWLVGVGLSYHPSAASRFRA